MPSFDPSVVPTISPDNMLTRFLEDETINIRWLTAQDPVYFSVLNRPMGDLALRQLILAKALGQLNLRAGNQLLYPFLVQPKITTGSVDIDIPTTLFWDVNVRLEKRFENLRLTTVTRLSGINPSSASDEYTGSLRFTFVATNVDSSSNDDSIFYVDMEIDSLLSFQIVRIVPAGSGADSDTEGFVIFRTPDQDDVVVSTFLDAVAPPVAGTTDSEGNYTSPTVYNVADTPAGGTAESNDFNSLVVTNGTGTLLVSVYHPLLVEIDPVYNAEKGQPLGTATLDTGGNVPASQLGNVAVEVDPVYNAEKGQPNGAATLDGGGDVTLSQLGNVPSAEIDPVYNSEKGQPLGAATLDTGGDVPLDQLGNVHSDVNDPTAAEKAALAGTFGSPSGGNRYVTDTDLTINVKSIESAVRRIRESSGPTTLTVGSIADGEALRRSGTAIVGIPAAIIGSQANMEVEAAAFVGANVAKFHPGVAKAWVIFIDIAGIPTIQAQYNVSSITDHSVGQFTVNLTTPFSSTNYVATGLCRRSFADANLHLAASPIAPVTASSMRFGTMTSAPSYEDAERVMIVFYGDLA